MTPDSPPTLPPYSVAACLYVKDVERDIMEWIAYHSIMGIDSFFIYDNGSQDNTVGMIEKIAPFVDVRVIDWGGHTTNLAQLEAYTDCLERTKDEFEWLVVIDSDEFLCSDHGDTLKDLLRGKIFSSAIALNWACFGSNGHVARPPGLMIEAFTTRSDVTFDPNRIVKMILKPRLALSCVNPHFFNMKGPVHTSDGSLVDWEGPSATMSVKYKGWKINHYFVRSREQWAEKLKRGYRDVVRDMGLFELYDRNEVTDAAAAARATEVKALINRFEGASTQDVSRPWAKSVFMSTLNKLAGR